MPCQLPKSLKTEEDLEKAFYYFYAEEQQKTGLKHLRFGQFIFNAYSIEVKNSYNTTDPFLAYGLICNYILNE